MAHEEFSTGHLGKFSLSIQMFTKANSKSAASRSNLNLVIEHGPSQGTRSPQCSSEFGLGRFGVSQKQGSLLGASVRRSAVSR